MNIMKKTAIIAAIATAVGGMATVKSFATDVQNTNNLKSESQNSQEINVAEEYKGNTYKIAKQTNIYSIPSFSSAHKKEISENTVVNVEEELNNWIQISFEGNTGWILKAKTAKIEEVVQVEEEKEQQEQPTEEVKTPKVLNKTAYIGVTKANIREKDSVESSVVGRLEQDTEITLLEELDGWYKIKSETIKEGYISKDLVVTTKPVSRGDDTNRDENTVSEEKNAEVNQMLNQENKKEETAITSVQSNGNNVVEYAKQYLGYKYVSGGKSPSSGFDCSGFTGYVYKKFGVTLGATAASQANVGKAVDKADLQPGDLLVFKSENKSKIGHVGIYVGGGQFIHAANAKKGVIITSLSMGYYAERYVGARRVV